MRKTQVPTPVHSSTFASTRSTRDQPRYARYRPQRCRWRHHCVALACSALKARTTRDARNLDPPHCCQSIGDTGDAGTLLPAYGAKTLAALASFQEAVSASYVPSCTFCVSNQNTDADQNSWIDHIFLSGFSAGVTVTTSRTFDTDVVVGMRRAADGSHTVAGKVPLSDHYGIRSTVRVTQ